MAYEQKAVLIDGPIGRTIIRLTIPMIFGLVGLTLVTLVDSYFIGKLGTNELAAITFAFPIIFILNGVSLGIGVGAGSLISKAIGEGNHEKVVRLTSDSLTLSLLIVIIFVIAGELTIHPVFKALGAAPDVMPFIESYMRIWYFSAIFVTIPMVGNSATRATGDTKTPGMLMVLAVILNIILDPILIFGWGPVPAMGIAGAGMAAVLSKIVILIVSLWLLFVRDKIASFARPKLRDAIISWKSILYIGMPTSAANLVTPIGFAIVTSIIAGYGSEAVAAVGVAARIEGLALTVAMALESVLNPFVGQNFGARRFDRLQRGIKLSRFYSLGWGVFTAIILALLSGKIGSLFNDNLVVIENIKIYMLIVPITYGSLGTFLLVNASLNALHKPIHATTLTFLRIIIFLVPLTYFGSYYFGLYGVFSALAAANILIALSSNLVLNNIIRKIRLKYG